ncbi:MAG: hypothetical protein HRT89_22285 [Lentisphaeria bacterium]|nr:hypothetical protein [Lentisphaeria bacterium]NQZ70787.1 hypothetical protein [Lentisphaeria bacterium]
MVPLSELGKYKKLAELFVLAMKADPSINVAQNNTALNSLMDCGLNERQAESFLNTAFDKNSRGAIRPSDETLRGVADSFRPREHGFILEQVMLILEAGNVNEAIQEFFDVCTKYLYHEEFQ